VQDCFCTVGRDASAASKSRAGCGAQRHRRPAVRARASKSRRDDLRAIIVIQVDVLITTKKNLQQLRAKRETMNKYTRSQDINQKKKRSDNVNQGRQNREVCFTSQTLDDIKHL